MPLSPAAPPIAQTLGTDQQARTGHHLRRWWVLALAAAVVAAAAYGWWSSQRTQGPQFVTQPAQQGPLVVTVTATGTLQPINKVEVGSELSGVIRSVSVDYNDAVKAGQVLARLDADKLGAQVVQSEAVLESARARVLQARTTVDETRQQYERVKALVGRQIVSEQDLVAAEAKYKRAQAELAVALADVSKAEAALNSDRINLAKTTIRAPISGVVLERAVEPGQTVAASLQAPVLFVLAEDLTQMELSVDVDEADVGQVREGQQASFTVDAHPERTFTARVTKVRFASKEVAGVVTYNALLAVDNAGLLLRPGMTATAEIVVNEIADTLLVPNAALRFTPPAAAAAAGGGGLLRSLVPRPPAPPKQKLTVPERGARHTVWTLRDGQPVSVPVTVGATDGRMTQVLSGAVTPGEPLLVDLAESRS